MLDAPSVGLQQQPCCLGRDQPISSSRPRIRQPRHMPSRSASCLDLWSIQTRVPGPCWQPESCAADITTFPGGSVRRSEAPAMRAAGSPRSPATGSLIFFRPTAYGPHSKLTDRRRPGSAANVLSGPHIDCVYRPVAKGSAFHVKHCASVLPVDGALTSAHPSFSATLPTMNPRQASGRTACFT